MRILDAHIVQMDVLCPCASTGLSAHRSICISNIPLLGKSEVRGSGVVSILSEAHFLLLLTGVCRW